MLWPSFCFVVISAQAMKDLCALSIAVAVSAQLQSANTGMLFGLFLPITSLSACVSSVEILPRGTYDISIATQDIQYSQSLHLNTIFTKCWFQRKGNPTSKTRKIQPRSSKVNAESVSMLYFCLVYSYASVFSHFT